MTSSTWARAPESSMIAAQLVDVGRGERRTEGGVQALGLRLGRGVERERDEHGALALDEVVAGGLAGLLGVAEDAEQVVAQLEGLAERQAEAASAARAVRRVAPARPAPMCSGRSMEYFADL